jgi:hypothetical protein
MRTATASTRHLEQTDHGARFQAESTSGVGSSSPVASATPVAQNPDQLQNEGNSLN